MRADDPGSRSRGMSRRRFVEIGAGSVALLAGARAARAEDDETDLTFGIVADLHYADAPTRGTRHYKDSRSWGRGAQRERQGQGDDMAGRQEPDQVRPWRY